jgi:polyisoprenoid-binding protein YceI
MRSSHILFTIDHLGFAKMVGLFSDFSGNITFDGNNVPASKLNVTIKTDSLQTQFVPRDKDLKGADRFNVTEFPEMTLGICKKGRPHRDDYGKAHPAWRNGYAQRCRK